jgi:hypothetical protein
MGERSGEDHMNITTDEGAAGLAKNQHRPDADRGGLTDQVPPGSKGVAQPGAKCSRLYEKQSRCSPGPSS